MRSVLTVTCEAKLNNNQDRQDDVNDSNHSESHVGQSVVGKQPLLGF